MNLLDEQFTRRPFYGVDRMVAWLNRQGHRVNPKRVRRLMRLMGLEAIYPKPRLSQSTQEHKRYPYLLTDVVIDRPDQVWCADITYIRISEKEYEWLQEMANDLGFSQSVIVRLAIQSFYEAHKRKAWEWDREILDSKVPVVKRKRKD